MLHTQTVSFISLLCVKEGYLKSLVSAESLAEVDDLSQLPDDVLSQLIFVPCQQTLHSREPFRELLCFA